MQDAGALKDKMGLTFDVYSDTQLQTIGEVGRSPIYDTNIAKPATFVIQKGGAVTFKKIGQEHDRSADRRRDPRAANRTLTST